MKRRKLKSCACFIRLHKKKYKIYCGKIKQTGNGIIREHCEICTAYNNGWDEGFKKKIQSKRTCQLITCSKIATRMICEKEFLIDVCGPHSNGKQWKEIKYEKR